MRGTEQGGAASTALVATKPVPRCAAGPVAVTHEAVGCVWPRLSRSPPSSRHEASPLLPQQRLASGLGLADIRHRSAAPVGHPLPPRALSAASSTVCGLELEGINVQLDSPAWLLSPGAPSGAAALQARFPRSPPAASPGSRPRAVVPGFLRRWKPGTLREPLSPSARRRCWGDGAERYRGGSASAVEWPGRGTKEPEVGINPQKMDVMTPSKSDSARSDHRGCCQGPPRLPQGCQSSPTSSPGPIQPKGRLQCPFAPTCTSLLSFHPSCAGFEPEGSRAPLRSRGEEGHDSSLNKPPTREISFLPCARARKTRS